MSETKVDYSKKWFVMIAVGLGIFLATIDGSIVNIALPTLSQSFGAPFEIVQWVVLAYLLTVTTLMPGVGRFADIRGKKKIYTWGFIIFTCGSVLCGLSPSIYALIASRIVQAVGAAMVMALGVAVVTESFPANERGRAIGISGTIVSVGIAIGPTLGGFLVENLSWHWIFFVNLPIGIVGTLMVMRYVPAVPPRGGQRFDFPGAILLFFALLTFLLAFTLLQSLGFESGWVIGMFVAWLVFLVAFIIVEFYRPEPMIDLRLFGNKLFSVNLLSSVLAFICLAGIQILMPFYLENILGYSPHQAGMLLVAVPLALGVVAPISGVLSDRFGTRVIAIVGLSILAMAFWGLSHLNFDTSSLAYFCLYLPIGIGFGFFQSPNNSAIMGIAPRDRLGVVSSMLAVSRTLGQVIGIAVMGALWASRVFYYEGSRPQGGATTAAAYSQVAGLQDILLLMAGVICLALVLYVWASWSSREKTTETPHPI